MRHWLTVLSCDLAFWTGCGGGNGIGPDEIRKREGRLRDQLPLSWNFYNQGQYEEAVDAFTRVLEDADNIEGIDDVLVTLARCCTPVPRDDIMGFVTRGRGISVHRTDCPNAASLRAQDDRLASDRLQEVLSAVTVFLDNRPL